MNFYKNIIQSTLGSKLMNLNLVSDGGTYKVLYHDRAFIIGQLLYRLIDHLKEGKSFESFIDSIYREKNQEVEKEEVYQLFEEKVEAFNSLLEDTSSKQRSNYILLKFRIANDRVVGYLSDAFCFLFKQKILYTAIVFMAIAQGAYFLFAPEVPELYATNILSVQKIIGAYMLAILILLFHELGHAAAAKYYGVKPKEIGFGFYLIFPVLYANVTEVWRLDKYKRIIVNLGGVYFQGLIHIGLIIYLCLFPEFNHALTIVFAFLYKINIVVILYALTPFFRNDGYWVYSDFFELPNLNKRANRFPKDLFLSFKHNNSGKNVQSFQLKDLIPQLPLLVYSVANYIVMAFFFFLFFKVLWITSIEIIQALFAGQESISISEIMLKILFLMVSLGLMIYNYRSLFGKIYDWIKVKMKVEKNDSKCVA